MKTFAFVLTLRCPLACSHCIVDSNPHRTETLDSTLVLDLIREAAMLGVESIGFTGGEPFLRPKELSLFHTEAKSLGLKTIIITSAFFSTSEERAIRVLQPFSTVDMLGFSSDVYHQQYTRLDNIRFAIRAAKQLKISRIELQIAYASTTDLNATLTELDHDIHNLTVRKQPIWPVGRAESFLSNSSDVLVPLDLLDLNCPMVGPVVTPDLRVQGCCSSLLNLHEKNPLILGDLSKEHLCAIVDRMESHPHYQLLKRFGLRPLLNIIEKANLSPTLQSSYTDACHLCHHLHSEPSLRRVISENIQPEVCNVDYRSIV